MFKILKNFLNNDVMHQVSSQVYLGQKNILLYFTNNLYCQDYIQQTNYLKKMAKLLTNPNLVKILNKYDVRLFVGAPHIEKAWKHQTLCKNIFFVNDDFVSASKEYMQMLVTDFSKLSLDFIASDRPIVFFQTNSEDKSFSAKITLANDKFSKHQNMLYNICSSTKEVCNMISVYVKKDFLLEESVKNKNLNLIAQMSSKNFETLSNLFY